MSLFRLFTSNFQIQPNTTGPLNDVMELVENFYGETDDTCILKINPMHQSNFLIDLERPAFLKHIYGNDCRPLYDPKYLIEQYDVYSTNNCTENMQKLEEVNLAFQSDLDSECKDILSDLTPDHHFFPRNLNENGILAITGKYILAYQKVKCLLVKYDLKNHCPTTCDNFMFGFLQHVEPALCQTKHFNSTFYERNRHCGRSGKKTLQKYKIFGNMALEKNFEMSKYCKKMSRNIYNKRCDVFSYNADNNCKNESIVNPESE